MHSRSQTGPGSGSAKRLRRDLFPSVICPVIGGAGNDVNVDVAPDVRACSTGSDGSSALKERWREDNGNLRLMNSDQLTNG